MRYLTYSFTRRAILFSVLLFAVFSFPACSKKQPESKEIKVGATLPLSGDAAIWGNNTREGIELALNEINERGGVLGKKVKVIYEDTEALPQKGVSAYTKLVQVDKVVAIIDDSVSSVTLAMAPLAQKDHIVILATGATAPAISQAGEYIFRIWNSDTYEGQYAAEYAFNVLGLRDIAILYINNDYGKGLDDVFTSEFQKLGGKIVSSQSFEQNSTDMRSQLSKIQATNPTGLYLVGYPKEIPVALVQAKELGISAKLIGTVAMQDPTLIENAREAAEGLMFPYPKDPSGKEVETFKISFKKKYGKDPGITSDVGYDAVKMLSKAVELSGGISGEDIRRGLNMLKDYPGASGVMTFDENGDVHKPMGIKVVVKGHFDWQKN
jgi:branched-chain amino acid transport system substrate-binding protein